MQTDGANTREFPPLSFPGFGFNPVETGVSRIFSSSFRICYDISKELVKMTTFMAIVIFRF
jgi:hypothetical protein